jgi:hypothetical protein
VPVLVDVPPAPSNLNAFPVRSGNNERVTLTWLDNSNNETGFTIQWSTSAAFTTIAGTLNPGVNLTTATTGNIARQAWYFRIRANNVLGSSAWVPTGQINPALAAVVGVNPAHSPLVLYDGFSFGLDSWTGNEGNVEVDAHAAMGGSFGKGLMATWGEDEAEEPEDQPAYVFHQIPNALGSFMANFAFNPNGAVTSDTPVDIFTGLDANGVEIFGIQYLHTAGAPGVYQIRGWTKTVDDLEFYTDWAPITNAEQELQLDWQSAETSNLNLYVGGAVVASVAGDTSLIQLSQERLGPSRGVASIDPSVVGTIYLDEFISLSTEIATPYPPVTISISFLPMVTR